jgi:hypothetical protein
MEVISIKLTQDSVVFQRDLGYKIDDTAMEKAKTHTRQP